MGFLKKNYFFLFILISILSLSLYSNVYAEVAGPGWLKGEAELLGHEQAATYYSSQRSLQSISVQSGDISIAAATLYQTEITPEIQELARALHYDPELIFEYVHNHIDYTPYFGLLKGPTLTYLDGSGNDFDQASLLVALLRGSNTYNTDIGSVQYAYGKMTIPTYSDVNNYDMENWLGLGDLGASVLPVIERTLSEGGIMADSVASSTTMDRVCVLAVIGGTPYILDPGFNQYTKTEGIDLPSAMAYDKTALLAAAGGVVGPDYVQSLSDNGIRTKLDDYTINLITFLRENYPNASIGEIIGRKKIIAEDLEDYSEAVKFALATGCTGCGYFDEIDDAYVHKVTIQYGGIDQTLSIPEIAGKKLAVIYIEGGQVASEVSSASTNSAAGPIYVDSQSIISIGENTALVNIKLSSDTVEADGDVSTQDAIASIDFETVINGSMYGESFNGLTINN